MKTKIEINGVEVEIEATDSLLTIKVEKEDETIEEFEIETGEAVEGEAEEGEESEEGEDIKAFGEFEEEEDFEDVPAGAEEEEEQFEESAQLESFTSFLEKQTKK